MSSHGAMPILPPQYHRLASSTISSHWVETLHESGQSRLSYAEQRMSWSPRPDFMIAEIILNCA